MVQNMSTLSPEQIRAARLAAGLSLRGAATALGVSKTTIVNSENGETSPGSDLLGRMSGVYGVTVDAFYVHEGNADTPSPAGTENAGVAA